MKMPIVRTAALMLGLATLALRAHGQEIAPGISFSGYGTLGAVHSDNDHADYLADAFHPNGPGFTRRWSADVDSRLGGQVMATFTPSVTAVLQVTLQQRYNDTYRPMVEWANVKYEATPDLSVRAGRVVLPVFMVTDSRLVGYANTWVRPPVEVYSLVPVTSSDGVDASYRMHWGAATNTIQLTLGSSDSKFPDSSGYGAGTAKARKIAALVDTWESGFVTARVSYGRARLTIPEGAPLFDAFRQFGPPGAAIADRYGLDDRQVTFLGLGASYDPGTWFLMGEWAKFNTHSIIGAKQAGYVSGGYRIGKVTPYATYARMKADSNTSDPGLSIVGLPPQLAGIAQQLNAILNQQLGAIPRQATASIGARWDFARNAAIKVQYDRVTLDSGSFGTFGNVQRGFFQPGGRVQLFSATFDFVF